MEKEYRLSGFIKIFYGLTAVVLAGFSIFLLTFNKPGLQPGLFYFTRLFGLAILTFAILIWINLKRKKVVIDDNSILYVSLFSRRQLEITDVKGCRIGAKRIQLEPLSSATPGILIGNYEDLRNSTELSSWVKCHFVDLDAQDLTIHLQEAANNPRFGATEAARLKYLQRSKDIAIAYNIWGFIAGFVLAFVKGAISSVLLMALPILGIVLILSTRVTVKFVSSSAVSPYPFVMPGVIFCSVAILGKSAIEYTLLGYGPLVAPGLAVAAILFVLLYVFGRNSTIRSVWSQIIIMGITALFYGMGSVKLINCCLDPHKPIVYSAVVLGHDIRHGRHVSYFLKLSPWGPRQHEQEVEVDHGFYNNFSDGDSVNVNLKPGLIHIPWYYLTGHFPPSPAAAQP
jgi:hypothetical protein